MDELTRRRMLWIALVLSAGFFALTMAFAAAGALTPGWYLLGAGLYAGVFLLALAGFVTERPEPPPEAAPAPPEGWITPPARDAGDGRVALRERVIYTTPRGQVLELTLGDGARATRDWIVETGDSAQTLGEVERRLDAGGWPPGEPPEPEALRAALARWGRIREVA